MKKRHYDRMIINAKSRNVWRKKGPRNIEQVNMRGPSHDVWRLHVKLDRCVSY